MAPADSSDARILQVAAEHVRKFGAGRTTVVGIAAEAGMSHANVYRYFPSKMSLLEALTEQWLRPLEVGLHEIADAPDPADDKLERILSSVYRTYRNKVETDLNHFVIFADSVEHGRAVGRRHWARLQTEISRVVDEGMASGVFRHMDQRRAVALVFDGLHRFLSPTAIKLERDVPREQFDARFERLTSVVLRALTSRG